MSGARHHVGRLVVRGGGAVDGAHARPAALRLVEAAELDRGLAPAATLVVREVVARATPAAIEAGVAAARAQAVRPALGPVPAGAPAVLFADDAELLACLARDLLAGVVGERWWWRARARPGTAAATAVARAWARAPAAVPAAVAELGEDAGRALEALGPEGRRAVAAAVAEAGVVAEPALVATACEAAPLAAALRRAHEPDAAPGRRLPSGARPAGTSPSAAGTPRADRPPPRTPAEQAPAPPPDAPGAVLRAASAEADPGRPARAAPPHPAAPELPPPHVAAPAPPVLRVPPTAPAVREPDRSPPVAAATPPRATRAPSPPRLLAPATPAPPPVRRPSPVRTRLGGAFLLVGVALDLGLFPDFTRPLDPGHAEPLPLWLRHVAAHLAGDRPDPLWALLAELGGGDERPPGRAGLRTDARRVRRRLGGRDVVRRRGEVHVAPGRVDVVLDLAELDVAIRLAGLDRDPGWLPSAGLDLRFHFR